MAANINRVIITGNLTRDPELRALPSGMAVCELGVAVNGRRKNANGEWEEKPNFFDVTVFGAQGENCSRYLAKGRPVAIDGRLDWQQWEQEGQKRQKVKIIADSVQFLGGRDESAGGSPAPRGDITVDDGDFGQPAPAGNAADEDIPF
ncbi:MAG: single-stranded DNA-binding protein [Actinomycetes bacterium]